MSVWEWVETGLINNDKSIPAMTGSFNVTIGDALNGIFGAQHNHIFGSYVNLICDPEDMLLGQLDKCLPVVSALLGGIGGNTVFTYGSSTAATYVGPAYTIQRAPSVNKTSNYVLPHVKASGPASAAGVPPVDPIDTAMLAAVAALSVLIICVPAALELTIRFKYPKYGSGEEDEETEETYGKSPEILKLCAYMITSRLMSFLRMLEEKGSWAGFAEQWAKEAEYLGLRAALLVAACIPIYGWAGILIANDQGAVEKALNDTKAALLAE